MNPKRFSWLVDALGLQKAEDLRSDLQKATVTADESGLERKNASATVTTPPPDQQSQQTPPEGDPVHAAAAKLATQIFDSLQGNLSALTADTLAAAIEEALRPAVEDGDGEESSMEQPTQQTKAEGEVKCPDCGAMNPAGATKCEKCGAMLPAGKALAEKSLGDLIGQMVQDQGEIAKSFAAQEAALAAHGKKIEEIEKSVLPVVQQLATEIQALKDRLDQRPRSASTDDSTVLNEHSEAVKALTTIMERGTKGEELTFLGAPVKKMPK